MTESNVIRDEIEELGFVMEFGEILQENEVAYFETWCKDDLVLICDWYDYPDRIEYKWYFESNDKSKTPVTTIDEVKAFITTHKINN